MWRHASVLFADALVLFNSVKRHLQHYLYNSLHLLSNVHVFQMAKYFVYMGQEQLNNELLWLCGI